MEICTKMGFSVNGFPGLVRLNPNIPYKTRGNGAVVFSANKGNPRDRKEVFQKLIGLIEKESRKEDENTNPGLVVTDDHFDLHHYVRAVREVHDIDDVKETLAAKENTLFHGFGNGRGLIGCVGAISWLRNFRDREMDHTYELISYRKPEYRIKTRVVDNRRVMLLVRELKKTFNSYDHANKKALIYPNSPCPVLFGVRGEDPGELERALKILDCREMERWQIFVTNQGTDDHLVRRKISEIENYTSVIAEGTVMNPPQAIKGGHVFFHITQDGCDILTSAFEPTKGFRSIVKALLPGDRVRLFGGVKGEEKNILYDTEEERSGVEEGFSKCINIEKMEVISLVDHRVKTHNPTCPECARRMKSTGNGKGYRCRRCHVKVNEAEAEYGTVHRELEEGLIYEVDGVARRHLSKPLKRMGKEKGVNLWQMVSC